MQPARQHLRDTTVVQMLRSAGHHPPRDLVPRQPAVAVGQPSRTDDERRVRHDEVEPSALHRLPEVAGEQLNLHTGPRYAGQGKAEPRQGQRPGAGVRRRHPPAVLGQVEGLHTASGAEIETGRDGLPNCRRHQRQRRAPDPDDVVGRHGCRIRPVVARDVPVAGVGPDVDTRPDSLGPPEQQAGHIRQHPAGGLLGHGPAEQEQADERVERVPGSGGAQRGHLLAPSKRGRRRLTEALLHPTRGIAGGREGVAQRRRGCRAEPGHRGRRHQPMLHQCTAGHLRNQW